MGFENEEEDVKTVSVIFSGMVLTFALSATLALAQTEASPHHRHHGMGAWMWGPEIGLPLHRLNLTDDQKAQVRQIFQTEKSNLQPLMQQEFQLHQRMLQLVTGDNFDSGKAAALASEETETHVQLEVEHAKIASQMYQLLSSDQKAMVADMVAKRQQRMEQHFNHPHNAPPNQ
ncbi:MAG: Spy/CpxP family protein refolding chaperone [Acidobacteria bacterium]|nr:Spy/CpxP family protein refolding chaperone [Acidobacteriota bacterium]